jgi:hypothetical protein
MALGEVGGDAMLLGDVNGGVLCRRSSVAPNDQDSLKKKLHNFELSNSTTSRSSSNDGHGEAATTARRRRRRVVSIIKD